MYNSLKRTQPASITLNGVEYPVPSVENAIYTLRPNATWEYSGAFIQYSDPDGNPEPTKEQIDAEVDRMENLYAFYEYSRIRKEKYGSVSNQLDLLYKDIESGLFGDSAKTGSWFTHVKTIKENYPKQSHEDPSTFVKEKRDSDGNLRT
tara:strand:- start:78 stop:524 length:447 start_codon:yes stop_codon:yes gene_type:complete